MAVFSSVSFDVVEAKATAHALSVYKSMGGEVTLDCSGPQSTSPTQVSLSFEGHRADRTHSIPVIWDIKLSAVLFKKDNQWTFDDETGFSNSERPLNKPKDVPQT